MWPPDTDAVFKGGRKKSKFLLVEVAPEPPSVVNPVTLSLKQAMKDKGRPHIKKLKSFGHCPNYLHFHRESMGNH